MARTVTNAARDGKESKVVVHVQHKPRVRSQGLTGTQISTGADDEGERKSATGALFGYRTCTNNARGAYPEPRRTRHVPTRSGASDERSEMKT
jgi:hypothetical protein